MAVPAVLAWATVLGQIIVPLALRLLGALGLGVATYTGLDLLLDQALLMVQSNINSLGADVLEFCAIFRVDQFITIVFSAMTVRLVFMGMQATGAITRMQWRAPAPGGGG